MYDQDVKDQLVDYGDWLKRSFGLDLSPPNDVEISSRTDPGIVMDPIVSPEPRRSRNAALIAAAAAVILVLVGAVFVLGNGSSASEFAVAARHDPTKPLYVLPMPLSPEMLRNAHVTDASAPGLEPGRETIVVGVRLEADAYSDLATIWIGGPGPSVRGNSTTLDLASGPAEVMDDLFTVIVQDRGGTTISVMTGRDRLDYATRILDSLTIDSDGLTRVGIDGEFEVIEAAEFEVGPSFTSTYLDVTSALATNGGSITVETATGPTPLLGAGALGGQLSAQRIQGVQGWTITRFDADGEWNGIAWQATPSHVIAVSGHAPLDAIQAVAESLAIVSEDEWKTALPNYTTD